VKKLLVVMTVYNEEKWVERAINSILNQTFQNFTLCIVNDCSTDNSLEKIQKYLNNPKVLLINNKKNMGAYYSRNVGLQLLEKENFDIYTAHDADDFSDSTRFEKAINYFNNEKLLSLEDYELRIGGMPPDWLVKLGETLPNHAHAFFSKKVFDVLGYFDNSYFGADTEYWHRLLRYIQINSHYTVFRIEELLYYAQVTGNNLTIKYNESDRDLYFKKHMKEINKMVNFKDFYRPFFAN
jgi:glycosyltransferase involved in cell wall biosynthesis